MRGAAGLALVLVTGVIGVTLPAASSAAAPAVAPAVAPTAAGRPSDEPTVVTTRVIGRSVQGRPIHAYRLGEPKGPGVPRVLLVAGMHGNEPASQQILDALRTGRPVQELDLWLIPRYNPDGLVAGTRRNARGVDLNRNFPHQWADLDGNYESGAGPGSEPETRAMMRFLRSIRPDRILSFHQPLHGVDTDTKDRAFARRVARALRLPQNSFDCGGVCHGTMTSWFNKRFRGSALTVEYSARPGRHRMRVEAPRQLMTLFGAWRGYVVSGPVTRR